MSIADPENPYRYLGIQGRVVEMTENGGDAHIDKMAKKYLGKDSYPFRTPGEVRADRQDRAGQGPHERLALGRGVCTSSRCPALPEVTRGADLAALIADAVGARRPARRRAATSSSSRRRSSRRPKARWSGSTRWRRRRWRRSGRRRTARIARVIEVILRESRRIVRMERGILIAETHHGFVCANAGVDASNVAPGFVTVLPRDPDASAERLRDALSARVRVPGGGHRVGHVRPAVARRGGQRGARRRRTAAARRLPRCRGLVRPPARRRP